MSKAWAKGSTRKWRQLRRQVLDRDNWRCQIVVNHTLGLRCDKWATHAGHIIAKAHGGRDTLGNLRAECADHSASAGTAIAKAHSKRRGWSW